MSRLHARRQVFTVGLIVALATSLVALTAPGAQASNSSGHTFKVLHHGANGHRVKQVQRVLDVKPVSGHFNDRTRHAVRKFQQRRSIAANGAVTERTWHALSSKWHRVQHRRSVINAKYQRIMKVARAQRGDPYVYGAAGPGAFDCSGYTMYVYRNAAGISLQHLAGAQFHRGHRISRHQARPGDLVFFHNGGSIYHAAIYAGHGFIWHAPHSGSRVHREHLWTRSVYYARILPRV